MTVELRVEQWGNGLRFVQMTNPTRCEVYVALPSCPHCDAPMVRSAVNVVCCTSCKKYVVGWVVNVWDDDSVDLTEVDFDDYPELDQFADVDDLEAHLADMYGTLV